MKPLCVDLFCGLGGWAEGFLAEGYDCRGYDIEAHDYGTGGYPGELILRDVRSVYGSECASAAVIVASPPCQAYSYRAMPWKRAKALPPPDNTLFNECWRIQREAIEAAGHYIPLVVENVRGAQKWVGRARANYGSFYLWGDVGMVGWRVVAIVDGKPAFGGVAPAPKEPLKLGKVCLSPAEWERSKAGIRVAHPNSGRGVKFSQYGHAWFDGKPRDKMLGDVGPAAYGSKSQARKMASAMIAKIPFPLGSYIARAFKP